MKRVIAHCGIGYAGAEYKEEFYFEDTVTESEIESELYEWANQFLEVWWEEKR